MARRRWIQRNGELIEVSTDYVPDTPQRVYIAGDRHYDGLVSPIDGENISTRTKHREYMARKGLTVDSDYKEHWQKAEKERERVFTPTSNPERKRDVEMSLYKVLSGYRPTRYPEE